MEALYMFLPEDLSLTRVGVGLVAVLVARLVSQRVRTLQLTSHLPGPSLSFSNKEWVDPFLAHFYPLVKSVGSIPKFPDYTNALWWYLKVGNSFAEYGMSHLWAFHPYWVPFARSSTFIFDADVARQLLDDRNNARKLIKAKRIYEIAEPLIGKSLLSLPDGPEWKHQRKRAAASFGQQLVDHVCEISVRLLETEVFPKWKPTNGNTTVPVEGVEFASRIALEILGYTAFGYKFGGLRESKQLTGEEEEESLYDSYMGMINYCVKRARAPPHVYLLWRDVNAKFQKASERLDRLIKDVVQRRLDAQVETEESNSQHQNGTTSSSKPPKDLLDYLVQKDDDGNRLPFDYIHGNVRMFFFAGHDTTAGTLANGLWHLATHPEQQARLQEEVDAFYSSLEKSGDDSTTLRPTHKQLNQLRYLDACARECLRLYSPGIVGRTCTEPIQLTGRNGKSYTFPTGSHFFVIPFIGHMCESYWENATEFCPERFLSNGSNKTTAQWIPFSVGARNCVGQPMAVAELKCLLAHIFRNYNVRPQEGADPPINTILLTVKPTEVPLVVEQRQHSS